jgi:hypothetical protein
VLTFVAGLFGVNLLCVCVLGAPIRLANTLIASSDKLAVV